MDRPSREEVQAEVKKLQEIKPKVRKTSAFGDDHHAAIDAQIDCLERKYDLDDTYDFEEEGDWAENVASAAREAIDWMNGESDEGTPSSQWESLIIR